MRALFLLLFTGYSLSAFATTNEEWAVDGARAFHEVLLRCPERLWPELDWSQTQFLFASGKSKQAWLIGAGAPQPEVLSETEVPPVAYSAAYSFFEFRGKTTVTIGLDMPFYDENMSPFDLAVHEMFHHYGQKGWKRSGGGRGTLVPLDFEPRYIRAEMLSALKAAYQDPTQLRVAADWYQEWSTRFPHELQSTTDGYEGTANYVETMSRILQRKTCAATDQTVQQEIAARLDRFQSSPGMPFDAEGYGLGALAGMMMDKLGMDWKGGVALGITPLSQLLAGKATSLPVSHPQLRAEFQKKYAELNLEIDQWRLPFEQKLGSTNYVRVAVPGNWGEGAYSPKGFYIPKEDPKALYTPFNGEHRFESKTGEWIVAADSTVGYSREGLEICPSTNWYFLVPRSAISEVNGAFRVNDGEVTFDVGGAYQTGGDGFTYLCSASK